jgi:hypothetical protein
MIFREIKSCRCISIDARRHAALKSHQFFVFDFCVVVRRITSFQCFTPENINQVVIDAFRGVGFMGPVFICSILFIGHWVMVHLTFGSCSRFFHASSGRPF